MNVSKNLLLINTNTFIEFEIGKKHGLSFRNTDVYYFRKSEEFKNDSRFKIAVYPYVENLENQSLPLISDLSHFDLVVLINYDDISKDPVLIHNDVKQSFNTSKYKIIGGGYNTEFQYPNNYFLTNFSHGNITYFNNIKHNNQLTENKIFDFDCLLGTGKPARKYIYFKFLENNLLSNSLVSLTRLRKAWEEESFFKQYFPDVFNTEYIEQYGNIESYRSPWLGQVEMDDYEPTGNLDGLFRNILEGNINDTSYNSRAYTLPTSIYNATKYSIVCETFQDKIFNPTEKLAKPIIAKRIFVVFSCHNFLKHLRNMGFKTFDSIIDESYDSIEDTKQRFDMVFEQVKYLSTLNYLEVYNKVADILEHNYKLISDIKRNFQTVEQFILDHDTANNSRN